MVARDGDRPASAASMMAWNHSCASFSLSFPSDSDWRRLVVGSVHRTRARYGVGRLGRYSMSVESRTPTGTMALSAIATLGGDGALTAQPCLDVEDAVHDDARRDRHERRPLRRLCSAPAP